MLRSTIFEEKKTQQITGMFVSKAFALGYKYRGRGIRVHMNSKDCLTPATLVTGFSTILSNVLKNV